MTTRHFQKIDSSKPVVTENYTFTFEPTHWGDGGKKWGYLALDDEDQANELAAIARGKGVFEIDAADAAKIMQKKSLTNISVITQESHTPSQRVEPVKANDAGETSLEVDSIDELLSGESEPAKEESEEIEPTKKVAKKLGRPRKS